MPDDTPYVDSQIVREGPVGDQGDGPYSAGRGGAGNIDREATPDGRIGDEEVVPETAMREHKDENYHYGRGGAGNEWHHKQKKAATSEQHGFDKKLPDEPLKDKIKDVFKEH